MEHNQLPPDSAVRPSEPQTIIQPLTPSGPEVLDLCVRRPTPPLTPRSPATPPHTPRSPLALTHEQPRFQPQAPAHKHEQLPAAAPFSWHSPAGSPESAAAAAGRPAALWRGPSPSSTHQGLPSPPLEPVAGPSNYYVLQQQLQAPPMLPMPVAVHPLITAPPQQLPPQLLKQRAIVACPDRYTPYSQPDLLARSPPLPLPAQSSTSPTPGSSAAGQNGPLAPAALAAAGASSMGFQEVGPLMLPLTAQASSGSRGGKPTRPFKAYPRDPLSFTAGMPLPDNWETSNRYQQYRMRVLASSGVANRGNGAARRAGAGAGARRNPPAQPAQQPSSSDANNNGEENAGRPDSPRRADRAGGAGGGGGGDGGGGAGADNNGQPQQQQQPQKDGAYWERRRRNNEAAKRSRDARRAKEDEVAIRAAFLEQENLQLRLENSAMRSMIQHWQQLFPHVQIVQQPMQQPQPQQQQQQQQQQQPMPSPGINPHSPQIELPAGLRPVPDCFG